MKLWGSRQDAAENCISRWEEGFGTQQVKDWVPCCAQNCVGYPVKARPGFFWSDAKILVHLELN